MYCPSNDVVIACTAVVIYVAPENAIYPGSVSLSLDYDREKLFIDVVPIERGALGRFSLYHVANASTSTLCLAVALRSAYAMLAS
jgi:hypothetical protein